MPPPKLWKSLPPVLPLSLRPQPAVQRFRAFRLMSLELKCQIWIDRVDAARNLSDFPGWEERVSRLCFLRRQAEVGWEPTHQTAPKQQPVPTGTLVVQRCGISLTKSRDVDLLLYSRSVTVLSYIDSSEPPCGGRERFYAHHITQREKQKLLHYISH